MYFIEILRALIIAPILPVAVTLGIVWPWRRQRPVGLLRLLSGSMEPEHLRSAELRIRLQRVGLAHLRRHRTWLPMVAWAHLSVARWTFATLRGNWVDLRNVKRGAHDGSSWLPSGDLLEGPLWAEWLRSLTPTLRFSPDMPDNYARNGWYIAARREGIEHFLAKPTRNLAFTALSRINGAPPQDTHFDKLEFSRRCRAADLPTPTIFSVFRDGAVEEIERPVPKRDLFSKALSSARAEGLYLYWEDLGNGSWRTRLESGDLVTVDLDGLHAFLAEGSRTYGPMLLQDFAANHPDIQAFVGHRATACARTFTCRFPGDSAIRVQTYSEFKYALRPEAVVDNSAKGGHYDLIESDSGVVRSYVQPERAEAEMTAADPLVLPYWKEIKRLSVEAHDAVYPEFLIIAWDFAITREGPVIIEGNVYFGGHGEYPGVPNCCATEIGACLRAHLENVTASDLARLGAGKC